MERNYWQEYWDNYYKFMAVYLRELQNAYPNKDITNEYVEVANLFAPSMPLEDSENYNESDNGSGYNNPEVDSDPTSTSPGGGQSSNPSMSPSGGQSPNPFTSPGGGQSPAPFTLPGGGQSPTPFISPGGGQFTINNCRRMAIVRIEMRRGFNPSNFFMIVDKADRRSIQGFRIACESGRIRFIPMAVEYRNINFIECAF
ncbi:MAG: hypothetical protein E6X43_06600 [Peptostreptococcaceae bacterium]|nr:hypothetical protein [Peptostreptococcaceae bacterium]